MANEEQLALDGLTLNDGTTFVMSELDMTPPRQKQEWIGAADSEWQVLMRAPKHENREILATLHVVPQSTTNLAMDKIGQIVDKFRLATATPDGIDLVWTPADGSRSVTFDCLAGEVVGLPVNWEEGWLVKSPTVRLRMVCKPYWYGTETLTTTASSSTPFVTKEITGVTGDIPALGRLIVTDTATQSRRHVEWGLEGQYYNASTSLLIDSDDMVTSGFSGAQTALIGGYDPNASGNNAISAGLITTPSAVCGTGNLSHVGTFVVKGRFMGSVDGIEVRLSWQAADGPWTSNAWVPLQFGGVNTPTGTTEERDLGAITIPPVTSGTQRWQGRVEARATSSTGTVYVDYLQLMPTEAGYGKARSAASAQAGTLVAYDQFTSTTAGNALNGRVAPAGGTWATSGAATDFVFADVSAPLATFGECVTRNAAGVRYAVIGSTNYTDMQVRVRNTASSVSRVIARWVDVNNHLYGEIASGPILQLVRVVSGTPTTLGSVASPAAMGELDLTVYANGTAVLVGYDLSGVEVARITASSSVLATSGALDDGKPGFADPGVFQQAWDDFFVYTPAAEPIVLYSGRNMQIRHDDTIRQDSTGTYIGRPPSYKGSRFLVPIGTSRVAVAARRSDIDVAASDSVTDATQIQIGWTPRGLVVPR